MLHLYSTQKQLVTWPFAAASHKQDSRANGVTSSQKIKITNPLMLFPYSPSPSHHEHLLPNHNSLRGLSASRAWCHPRSFIPSSGFHCTVKRIQTCTVPAEPWMVWPILPFWVQGLTAFFLLLQQAHLVPPPGLARSLLFPLPGCLVLSYPLWWNVTSSPPQAPITLSDCLVYFLALTAIWNYLGHLSVSPLLLLAVPPV